jgi:hypothetical protein
MSVCACVCQREYQWLFGWVDDCACACVGVSIHMHCNLHEKQFKQNKKKQRKKKKENNKNKYMTEQIRDIVHDSHICLDIAVSIQVSL